MGEERAVKNMDLSAFDWHSSHNVFGSPLHAILFGKLIVSADEESDTNELNNGFDDLINADGAERKSRLSLLRYAMRCGADPHIVAPKQCDVSRWWGGERGGDSMKPISFAGRSAFECLLAAKRSIKLRHQDPNDDADWTDELKAVDEAIDVLARPWIQENYVSVHEDVVSTWDAVLQDSSFADVIIRISPGPSPICSHASGGQSCEETSEGETDVHAHGMVLAGASSVLKAMLATSSMREGAQRIIEVSSITVHAVRLLLLLLYTGQGGFDEEDSWRQEPDLPTVLAALDLAHRWQLLHVVQLLASAAVPRIDCENFEATEDLALRLEVPALIAACRSFVTAHSREMRLRLSGRGYNPIQSTAVRADLERMLSIEGTGSESGFSGTVFKRRRRLL